MYTPGPSMGSALGLIGFAWALTAIVWMLFLAFVLIYILGHVRERQTGQHEPLLGIKVMLTLLMSLSFHILILGVAVFFSEVFGSTAKAAFKQGGALVVAGILTALYPAIKVRRLRPVEAMTAA